MLEFPLILHPRTPQPRGDQSVTWFGHAWACFLSSDTYLQTDDQGWDVQYLFEDFVLDADRRELARGSEAVTTGPQVFDLLLHLVQNRERVISKDNLIDVVWGGRIVSDSTLTSHINAVRKAIGDTGEEQRLVRTLARKGYRFVGEVREVAASNQPDPASLPEGHPEMQLEEPPDSAARPAAPALTLPDRPSIAM